MGCMINIWADILLPSFKNTKMWHYLLSHWYQHWEAGIVHYPYFTMMQPLKPGKDLIQEKTPLSYHNIMTISNLITQYWYNTDVLLSPTPTPVCEHTGGSAQNYKNTHAPSVKQRKRRVCSPRARRSALRSENKASHCCVKQLCKREVLYLFWTNYVFTANRKNGQMVAWTMSQ